jgi:hypothetical protein
MITKTRIGNHLRRHDLGDQPTFRQGFKEGVEFALKRTQPKAKQEPGEPVAWMFEFPDKRLAPKFDSIPHGGNWQPLYTAPQQHKPLTDEEIET